MVKAPEKKEDGAPEVKQAHFTVPVETMMQMERITKVIGIPKEKFAILVMRAQKKGML